MAELIAGEEAAKGGKGGAAAAKKVGNGKGGKKAAAGPFPPLPSLPPVPAVGEAALTKAQIKRRKAKAAAAARKAAAASRSAVGEEDEEEGSDLSSGDSDPLPRSRPPLDFSKDSEFRRSLKLPPRDVEAEIDEIIAQNKALYSQRRDTQTGAAPPASIDTVAARASDASQPSSTAATHFVESSLETSKYVEQESAPPLPSHADGLAEAKDAPTLSEPPVREAGGNSMLHFECLVPAAPLPQPAVSCGVAPSLAGGAAQEGLHEDNSCLLGKVASLKAEVSQLRGELAESRAALAARDAALAAREAEIAALRAENFALRSRQ